MLICMKHTLGIKTSVLEEINSYFHYRDMFVCCVSISLKSW